MPLNLPYDFNPRSLAGATDFIIIVSHIFILFQSTLPRGSDLDLFVQHLIY